MELEAGKEILKANIVKGMLEAYPSNKPIKDEVQYEIELGLLRFKTRDASPDSVTIVYLNGKRLYKIMVDCRQTRHPEDFGQYLLTKLDRESFSEQVAKLLAA